MRKRPASREAREIGNDTDNDSTLDFGFIGTAVNATTVGVGNVVFYDQNGNGHYDVGEGVDGVWMLIFADGTQPGSGSPVAQTTTSNGGRYFFSGLQPGTYVVHVAADNFKSSVSINGGPVGPGPLYNRLSVAGVNVANSLLDDDVGEDGIDVSNPVQVGINSRPITLALGAEPTDSTSETGTGKDMDNANDANSNMTVDFGFVDSMVIGNLVFRDNNADGKFTAGMDFGIDGVKILLYPQGVDPQGGDTPPAATILTSGGGLYSFAVVPGSYFLYLPPWEFAAGGPLANMTTTGNATMVAGDDDLGDDTIDGTDIITQGAATGTITLVPHTMPISSSGESGYHASDDDGTNDNNGNLTIDLGFKARPLCVGNLVFADLNNNGQFDGSDMGIEGVKVELFTVGSDPYSATTQRLSTLTDANGVWQICVTSPGDFFAFIPPSEFAKDKPLFTMISSTGVTTGAADDNIGEKGADQVYPAAKGIATGAFTLTYNALPVSSGAGATETGYGATSDDADDANSNLTIDFGFTTGVGVGNLVFKDANSNSIFDQGDAGIAGVEVQLYRSTDSPTVNSPVATFTTTAATANSQPGRFGFLGLMPGSYFLYIGPNAFLPGNQLANMTVSPTTLPNGDDQMGQDGQQASMPSTSGVQTGIFTLSPGNMPTNTGTLGEIGTDGTADDAYGDASIDMTRDFGFAPNALSVGNLVFNDRNNNGRFDPAPVGAANPSAYDEPISGVKAMLYTAGSVPGTDAPMNETYSAADGSYSLQTRVAGSYFVHIPASQFMGNVSPGLSRPLWGFSSSGGASSSNVDDDQTSGENGIDNLTPWTHGISSNVFSLSYGGQGTTTQGETGYAATGDDAIDTDVDLTVDFGFYEGIGIGNFVFVDTNGDSAAQGSEGVGGVTVEVWQNGTSSNAVSGGTLAATTTTSTVAGQIGRWLVTGLPPGYYYVKIPATQFGVGAPLDGKLPLFSQLQYDDQGGEDTAYAVSPKTTGVVSRFAFNFIIGDAATATSTPVRQEVGQGADMDDIAVAPWLKDADVDLTWDMGFRAPSIVITPATLASASAGTAYTTALSATGGTAPYVWTLTSGTLPSGMTLSNSGVISGTTAASTTATFTVRATDANNSVATRTYTLAVSQSTVAILPASLPTGTVGTPYSAGLSATGGTAPYVWTQVSGTMPAGLTLSASNGLISGTPTATGSFNFAIRANDSTTKSGTINYTLVIGSPSISITPVALPGGARYTTYNTTLTAGGGVAPYSWMVTAGSLPAGLSFSGSGVLSGTPTVAGTTNFTVSVNDAFGSMGSFAYTFTVAAPTLTISPSSVPAMTIGQTVNGTFQAAGGTGGPYAYSIVSGLIPPGLTLNTTTGAMTGSPTTLGAFTSIIRAVDGNGAYGLQNFTSTVVPPSVTITPSVMPDAYPYFAYNQLLTATGGTGPYSWAIVAGTMPQGLTLSGSGVISGTPYYAGEFFVGVSATDSGGLVGVLPVKIKIVNPTLTLGPSTVASATVGTSYSTLLTATGGGGSYTWSKIAGSLPPGLSVTTPGTIAGTPTQTGSFIATILAKEPSGAYGVITLAIDVKSPTITISPTNPPAYTVGSNYSQTLTASGGTAPYTWSIVSGAMPTGMTLADGVISGISTTTGTSVFSVKATDANSYSSTTVVAMKSSGGVNFGFTPSSLPTATVGSSYISSLTATGGTAPYTWSVLSGALPAGLTLNATTGTISGTPTASGSFGVTLRALDSGSNAGSVAYTLNVNPGTITVTPLTLPNGTLGSVYNNSLNASGGTPSYTWTVVGGTLPSGVNLSPSGSLTGTPTVSGNYPVAIRAQDSTGNSRIRNYVLTINTSAIVTVPSTLPKGTTGVAYSATFGASGGSSPYTFNVSGGNLPPTFSLSTFGILSGSTTIPGIYTFLVKTTDNAGAIGLSNYTLNIGNPSAPAAGSVRRDLTASGDLLASTSPLSGVTVNLYVDPNADGVLSAEEAAGGPFATDVTDTNGDFVFNSVPDGTYLVIQSLLPGAIATYDSDGGDKACTSIQIEGNVRLPSINFLQCYEPTGMFYNSTTGEIVPEGQISLTGPGEVTTMQDGSNGRYCVSVKTEGDYTLSITPPPGYIIDPARPALTTTWTSTVTNAVTVAVGSPESTDNAGFVKTFTASANPWHTKLHLKVGPPCPVSNNIPVVVGAPSSFAQWQLKHPGSIAPHDNADGDAYDNLMEYALGLDPANGVFLTSPFHLEATADRQINAVLVRSTLGHSDLNYRLEGTTDLVAQNWSPLPLAPAVESNSDGTDTVRYSDIATASIFSGKSVGYVRLKVNLDTDHDGTPEESSTSPIYAFTLYNLPIGQASFSLPLLRDDVFEGIVTTVADKKLDVSSSLAANVKTAFKTGTRYYIEVVSGSHEGERLEVDVTSTTNTQIATTTSPASDLAGARIAVRPHWTLSEVFKPQFMHGSSSATTSDRVMFFRNDVYKVHWMLSVPAGKHWLAEGDATLADSGSTIIAPSEGLILAPRTTTQFALVGQVRANKFALPIQAGAELVGAGWPIAQSTEDREMTLTNGFDSNVTAPEADRIRIFLGDTTPGQTGYTSYFFKRGSAAAIWTRETDNIESDATTIFQPFRAAYIVTSDGAPDWKLPRPW